MFTASLGFNGEHLTRPQLNRVHCMIPGLRTLYGTIQIGLLPFTGVSHDIHILHGNTSRDVNKWSDGLCLQVYMCENKINERRKEDGSKGHS